MCHKYMLPFWFSTIGLLVLAIVKCSGESHVGSQEHKVNNNDVTIIPRYNDSDDLLNEGDLLNDEGSGGFGSLFNFSRLIPRVMPETSSGGGVGGLFDLSRIIPRVMNDSSLGGGGGGGSGGLFDISRIIPRHFVLSWKVNTFGAEKNKRRKKIRYLFTNKTYMKDYYHPLERDGSDAGLKMSKGSVVKILIHGFTHHDEGWEEKITRSKMFLLADEYITSGKPMEIIIVDWTDLSSYPPYLYREAADSTQFVGVDLAEFLINLEKQGIITYDKVHIVGYSLGAHIAGVAGFTIQEGTGKKIGRITGIEPAGPLFVEGNKLISERRMVLDKTDAEFVDIIHCNMGDLYEARLGSKVQAGHADFYPNGGKRQTGCDSFRDATRGCSHGRCPIYYVQSVNRKKFPACRCASWKVFNSDMTKCNCQDGAVKMGEHLNTLIARGRYYLHI